jgi:hypothetical protein
VTGRQGRRRRNLLDDLKERRGYSHLKDRTMWRARFGRGFGPVVRQIAKLMNHISYHIIPYHIILSYHVSYIISHHIILYYRIIYHHIIRVSTIDNTFIDRNPYNIPVKPTNFPPLIILASFCTSISIKMKAERYAETSTQSYYPINNNADDYNLKCCDALCSGLIIFLKSIFYTYCK